MLEITEGFVRFGNYFVAIKRNANVFSLFANLISCAKLLDKVERNGCKQQKIQVLLINSIPDVAQQCAKIISKTELIQMSIYHYSDSYYLALPIDELVQMYEAIEKIKKTLLYPVVIILQESEVAPALYLFFCLQILEVSTEKVTNSLKLLESDKRSDLEYQSDSSNEAISIIDHLNRNLNSTHTLIMQCLELNHIATVLNLRNAYRDTKQKQYNVKQIKLHGLIIRFKFLNTFRISGIIFPEIRIIPGRNKTYQLSFDKKLENSYKKSVIDIIKLCDYQLQLADGVEYSVCFNTEIPIHNSMVIEIFQHRDTVLEINSDWKLMYQFDPLYYAHSTYFFDSDDGSLCLDVNKEFEGLLAQKIKSSNYEEYKVCLKHQELLNPCTHIELMRIENNELVGFSSLKKKYHSKVMSDLRKKTTINYKANSFEFGVELVLKLSAS